MTASGPSKVVVLDPDARASRQVQLGFEREGIETVAPAVPADLGKLELGLTNGDAPGLALVGGSDIDLVRRTRELLVAGNADVPILFTGHGGKPDDVIAAGADAVLSHPVYLRDVVTIGRILRNVPREHRDHLVGSLVETSGVYALARALCALGRSAVLTLIRGLRRGEIRFYRGEVTSAQVGLIHGQAAFHQLLLWTDARFDFAYEDIVRRAQIPMSAAELFKDAERFLEGVRESADLLSPSMVLEVDTQRVQSLGTQVPTEVHGVLRMFDGHRVLADILEDSPYRVFETLRVAQKAMEAGLLRTVAEQRPKTSWRAVLAIEEWLVGSETRDSVSERTAPLETGPVGRQSKPKFKKKGKRKKSPSPNVPTKPIGEPKPTDIDWGALVPRSIGAEVGSLSGVVPAMDAHGEIDAATREKKREKLEALMDTDKRDRIFPTDIGLEPSVVVRNEDTDEWERIEWEAKAKHDAEAVGKAEAAIEAQLKAKAKAEAEAKAASAAKAAADAKAKADADAKAAADAKADADAKAKAEAKADANARAAADARAKAEADAKAKADADAKAKADADAKAKADADAKSKADADEARFRDEAQARVRESVERMRIDRSLRDEAEAREREQAERSNAAEEARTYAARVKAAAEAKREEAERAAQAMIAQPASPSVLTSAPPTAASIASASPETSPERGADRVARSTDAASLVRDLVADIVPPAPGSTAAPGPSPAAAPADDRGSTRVIVATPITVSETSTATVQLADKMTVVGAADTATVTSTPLVTVRGPAPKPAPASSANPLVAEPIRTDTAAPGASADAPSDGTPRARVATVETAPLGRELRKPATPDRDGPPVKETRGEIGVAAKPSDAQVTQGPSILIDVGPIPQTAATTPTPAPAQRAPASAPLPPPTPAPAALAPPRPAPATLPPPTPAPAALAPPTPAPVAERSPAASDPSTLVADLAAAHAAIAAATARAASAPSLGDSASSSKEMLVSEVRKDAVEFTQEEEAFFNAPDHKGHTNAVPKFESFDDLDEGYEPPKFWDRVFGRKKKKPH
jgi:hypothetical protein